jgi:hypothetical protein
VLRWNLSAYEWLLCTEKNEISVKYATGGVANVLFISNCRVVLHSNLEMKIFVEYELVVLRKNDMVCQHVRCDIGEYSAL